MFDLPGQEFALMHLVFAPDPNPNDLEGIFLDEPHNFLLCGVIDKCNVNPAFYIVL